MREIWQVVQQWQAEKQQVALATVVQVTGSSLRPEGSKLVISSGGAIHGSVTGGCVEGVVFEEAREVLKDRAPRLLSYGVTNQQAWDVATFMNSHERPQDPRFTGDVAQTRAQFHDSEYSLYGTRVDGRVLGQGRR